MSNDINIKSYAGEISDSVAENQQIVANTYQDTEEYPVHKELLDQPSEPVAETPVVEDSSKTVEGALSNQELNFRALREEISRIKTDRDDLKQNLEILRANVVQKPQEPSPETTMFKGLRKDDIPNVEDIERVFKEREEAYQARIEELQVAQQHPDYAEVMEKHLTPLLKQKPHLVEGIQGAKNKALFAYELAKMAQNQRQAEVAPPIEAPTQKSSNAQKIVENARKPGTLSQTGGQSVLSKADYYATMSDAEFWSMAQKNLDAI